MINEKNKLIQIKGTGKIMGFKIKKLRFFTAFSRVQLINSRMFRQNSSLCFLLDFENKICELLPIKLKQAYYIQKIKKHFYPNKPAEYKTDLSMLCVTLFHPIGNVLIFNKATENKIIPLTNMQAVEKLFKKPREIYKLADLFICKKKIKNCNDVGLLGGINLVFLRKNCVIFKVTEMMENE